MMQVPHTLLVTVEPGSDEQRVAIVLALGKPADIYLIDEGMPATTDVEFNKKAGSIIEERLNSTTIVIVSHDPKTLEKFAQQAAVLSGGQLYMFDTLEEAKQLYDYETKS